MISNKQAKVITWMHRKGSSEEEIDDFLNSCQSNGEITEILTTEELRGQKRKELLKKVGSVTLFAIIFTLFIIGMMYISYIVAIWCNRYNYLNSPNILLFNSYVVGLPVLLCITVIITSLFGRIPINDIWKTELARVINILLFYVILALLYKEADVLVVVGAVLLCSYIALMTISSSMRIIFGEARPIMNTVAWCWLCHSIMYFGISFCITFIKMVPDIGFMVMTNIIVIHTTSLLPIMKDKLRYKMVLIPALLSVTGMYWYETTTLSDKEYLRDFYNNGYETIFDIDKYELQEGNLYTVYKTVGENAYLITSDNVSYANLGNTSDKYELSLYETQQDFIVFNWERRDLECKINKGKVKAKADQMLRQTFDIQDSTLGKGEINATLTDGNVVSLYFKPIKKGIQLVYTDKDFKKYNIENVIAGELTVKDEY